MLPLTVYWASKWTIYTFAWTNCKLTYFCWYFFHHYSSALLIIMSVEKFFALYFPLKTQSVCTVKTARRVSFGAAVAYITFDSQMFFIMEAVKDDYEAYCIFRQGHENYHLTFNQIDSVLYSFGPFTVMGLANLAIIYKFMRAKIKSKDGGTQSTSQALNKAAMRGTGILITVSLTFIILTGPVSIVFAVNKYPNPIVELLVQLTATLNHGINAALYCIVGSKFRQELLRTLSCCTKGQKHQTRSQRKDYVSQTQSTIIYTSKTECPTQPHNLKLT